jgi:hypothetical protein
MALNETETQETLVGADTEEDAANVNPLPNEEGKSHGPLELITKGVAIFSVAAYIYGMLTTNYFLYRIGESDFVSLKLRFIYTGAVVIMPPLTFALAFVALMTKAPDLPAMPKCSNKSFWGFVRWVVVDGCKLLLVGFGKNFFFTISNPRTVRWILFLPTLGLLVYIPFRNHGFTPDAFRGIKWLVGGALGVSLSLLGVIWVAKQQTAITQKILGFSAFCVLLCFASLNYIQAWADHVYPYMGDQFGGGKGRIVRLWIVSESPLPVELGIRRQNSAVSTSIEAGLSDGVTLIMERDDHLVLCTHNRLISQQVIHLDKTLVSGMQLLGPPRFVNPCWGNVP